ncbi:MAG: 6-pyruvoyl-tetrahydropterin synthase-related protein [bacterium]|nr:6-pyruvoyl-tetrahydropterin synthase-related protein [bacterium]
MGRSLFCVLLLMAAVLILLHPVFRPGFLVYLDNPAHLAEAHAFVGNVRLDGCWLDSWSVSNSAGYPLLLYQPKTAFYLIAVLHFIVGASVVFAYKLVVFLSILLPVMGVFFFLRKDSLMLPALFCSLLFLCQNNLVHYSLSGLSSNALATGVLFLFGTALFRFTDRPTYKRAVAAGILLGLLSITHLYIMLGGIALWSVVFLSFLLLGGKEKRPRALLLLLVPVVGFLTSCFHTYPVARASGWLTPAEVELPLVSFRTIVGNLFSRGDFFSHGEGSGMGIPVAQASSPASFLLSIIPHIRAAANLLGNAAIVLGILFAILGVFYAFDSTTKARGFCVRVVSVLLFIVVSSAVASGIVVPGVGLKWRWLEGLSFLRSTKIHGYRFMVLARAGMLYLSAYGLSRFVRDRALPSIAGLGKFSLAGKFRWPVLIPLCGIVFLAANLPFFFYARSLEEIRRNPLFPARDSTLLTTSSQLPPTTDLLRVCEWLKESGNGGNRRVFLQNTLGNALLEWKEAARASEESIAAAVETKRDTVTHFTHLPAISSVYSGMPQIGSWIGGNLFPIEKISISESGRLLASRVDEFDDLDLVLKKRYLQRLNIQYLVSCEPRLRFRLTASRFFEHKASFGSFEIFELREIFYTPHKPGWAHFSLPSQYIPNNKIEVTRFDNSGIDIAFENYATIIDLYVSVCNHPFWQGSVDGKTVKIESDDIGLIKIPLEVKDESGENTALLGKHILKLRYAPDRGASVVITLASLAVSVLSLLLPSPGPRRREVEKSDHVEGACRQNEITPPRETANDLCSVKGGNDVRG